MGGGGVGRYVVRCASFAGLALLLTAPLCNEENPDAFVVGECDQGEDRCCGDSQDNDGDSHIDCADKDCLNVGPCRTIEGVCDDGLDDDGDGYIDCDDPDCGSSCSSGAEICNNRIDDDGNGDFDCAEPVCATTAWCAAESSCNDLVDNDNDGATDCNDPGCAQNTACFGEVMCGDNVDNDGDGPKDISDPSCTWTADGFYCMPGHQVFAFRTSMSVAIPDGGTLTKTIKIPMTGRLFDGFLLRLSITHPSDAQLDIYLTRPGGTPQAISTGNGTGANYTSTQFRDDLGGPITLGTSPFYGDYKPEVAFSTYVYGSNRTLDGDWVLTITDNAVGSTGFLTSVDFAFCVDP